ncbi:MAG TPA: DUF305 domain-containing protein [Nocardioides sp.]|nr:DUF305 domain-containing protein [Nocardioides sp.]
MGLPRLRTTGRVATASAGLALLAGLLSAGCSTEVAPMSARVAEPAHNHADLAFAAEMVPHHEQGVRLADMVAQHGVAPRFAELAGQIAAGQTAEIEEMEAWLTAWDEEPAGGEEQTDDETLMKRSLTGAMRGMMRTRMGPWALGAEELEAMVDCPSTRFEERWLRTMITHHQGAISMARHEITHGAYPPAIALAEQVITTQQAEVEQMRQLLRD